MKKNNLRLKGQLKMYMQWPFIMTILLVAMNLWVYSTNKRAGMVMSVCVVIYLLIACALYLYNRTIIFSDMIQFATQYGVVQNTLLKELVVPYVLVLEDGRIIWENDTFQELVGSKNQEKMLAKIIPELNRSIYPKSETENIELEITYKERDYSVQLRKISVEGFSENEALLEIPEEKEYFVAISLTDVTELNEYVKENEEQRLIAGLIYVDNYDEVMDSVEEVRQSLLVALIDRKINQYIGNIDGIVKKLEKDKYFIVIKKKSYYTIQADKFSLLEDVKNVNIGNARSATLSIGLGMNTATYAQSYNYARVAIDLALARGGDQAVIKDCHGITYFGGKKEQTAKNTRVKARVKAEALREFIVSKDEVIVMGHRISDADSLGACVGIYRAAVELEKKAHIVINDVTSSVRPLYDEIAKNKAYPKDIFLTSDKVRDYLTDNTMVVVVDTNKAEMTDCPELLKKAKTIAVLDHHRQGSNVIENAVLSYIEPYSSSTCEMVAEVLQYIVEDIKLPSVEADCLYAGIMIDTRNFMNRTGVRTFEAAAFLRRCGADITRVRKMFRDDMDSYRAKAEAIRAAEVYRNEYAISVCPSDISSPTVLAAQAANELLDISGIKASFVMVEYNNQIFVSARSIDELNVQLIAEALGGGGHINSAGMQFKFTDMSRAIRMLKETIDTMIEEGDI
ncbi:MAG: DHH family phosphoesterase [Hespellia sp.]|nr:DHH family phosphoesterase [Hespellia sp.]